MPARFGYFGVLAGLLVLSASPTRPALAQAGGVKGQDVMQDRAGPDGWVQAPIPRDQAPSGAAPGEGKPNKSAESGRGNVPDTGKRLRPGRILARRWDRPAAAPHPTPNKRRPRLLDETEDVTDDPPET